MEKIFSGDTPLWRLLPQTCCPHAKIEEDCYDWWQRHFYKIEQTKREKYEIVLIGDSITHFWHDEPDCQKGHEEEWQRVFSSYTCCNLGYGYDRPQNALYHLVSGELSGQNPRLFVINIGGNCLGSTARYEGDTPEDAALGGMAVISECFRINPQARMVVMANFPRSEIPYGEPREEIFLMNECLKKAVSRDPRIRMLDIGEKFLCNGRLDSTLFEDGIVHPNNRGYRIWGDALAPWLPIDSPLWARQ